MFLHMTEREKELEQQIRDEQKEHQQKWYHYLISVLIVLLGLVFIVDRDLDVAFLCRLFACVFAAAGVISIITYCIKDVTLGYYRLDLAYGMMALFAAVLFFTKQEDLGTYFPLIAGAILVANGVVKFQHSIDMKRIDRRMKRVTEAWLVVMIFALICMTAGAVASYMNTDDMRKLFIFAGIAFIVAGASDIFTNIAFNRKVKLFRSGQYGTEDHKEEHDTEDKTPATEEDRDDIVPAAQSEPDSADLLVTPGADDKADPQETAQEEDAAGQNS